MRRLFLRGGLTLAVFFFSLFLFVIYLYKTPISKFTGTRVLAQTVFELTCPLGTTSVQALQSTDNPTGKLRQNWCMDNSGNVFISGNITGTINTAIAIGGNAPQIGSSADIGAQINAAYLAAPSFGQKAFLLPQTGGGCYSFSTPIVLSTSGKYFPIEGIYTGNQTGGINQGTCLNYVPTTSTAITIDYSPATGGGYTGNTAFKNVLLNNGSSACITVGGCGGSANGIVLGPNGGTHFSTLENIKVQGFGGIGITLSQSVGWGGKFENVSAVYNTTGLSFSAILENVKWHGGTISANGTGIICSTSSGITFESVSFDINSTTALNNSGCNITFIAPWFENAGGVAAQYITQSGGQFTITGGQILDDANSGTNAQFITTTGGLFNIWGTNAFSGGRTITNFVNNSGGGSGSILITSPSPSLFPSLCASLQNCSPESLISGASPPFGLKTANFFEFALGSGVAGFDVCGGVSATHTLQCSYNNDTVAKMMRASDFLSCGTTSTCAKTAQANWIELIGGPIALSAGTITITSLPFTSATSYVCSPDDSTGINGFDVIYNSGSSVTFNGTGTDTFRYSCVGN